MTSITRLRNIIHDTRIQSSTLSPATRPQDSLEDLFITSLARISDTAPQLFTLQEVDQLRTHLRPPEKITFLDKVKIALGLDDFESSIQKGVDFLSNIKKGKGIQEIPDLMVTDALGNTPAHLAVRYSHPGFIEKLLRHMTSEQMMRQNNSGDTILHLAASRRNREILDILLGFVPISLIKIQNHSGMLPLHSSAQNQSLSSLEALIELMPAEDLGIPDNWGRTALIIAADAQFNLGAKKLMERMHPEHILHLDKTRYSALDYFKYHQTHFLIPLLIQRPGVDFLMCTAPNPNVPPAASLLLEPNFTPTLGHNSAKLVRMVLKNLEQEKITQQQLDAFIQEYVFDGLNEHQQDFTRHEFEKNPSLKIPYLLTCMGILIPQAHSGLKFPLLLQQLGFYHFKAKNRLIDVWGNFSTLPIPHHDPLSEEDLRLAANLIKGASAHNALQILKDSGRWNDEACQRLINAILLLEDLNPA